MQSSQDEESPWVEDDNAPSHHAEAEWTGLSTNFTTASYRDGISSGKKAALQEGFDADFARTGAPRGRELGVLRGFAAAFFLHLSRSCPAQPAQTRVREIVDKLAAVHFRPDEEAAVLHRADADAQCGVDEVQGQGQSPPADDLRALRTQLESVLLEAALNVLLGLDQRDYRGGLLAGLTRGAQVNK
ncbi:hypothetical protein EDB92DRAFT_1803100 [Lactarius akahatsu]|uniref:Protein YAE1 n=1 Tax=Lactarius akahatsu TaxID=416441 RepID=A0AAD4QAF2_9AGAM|nr:hypothetical protein EDB92DRAFT_1803100 [Lactarius akahatsu]